jgi:hypothetical protein
MGRHRQRLDQAVLEACGGQEIDWLDFQFSSGPRWHDAEWKGLHFLPKNNAARMKFSTTWPQTGNVQNWDAVGRIRINDKREWLLVEAKAHLEELISSCGAKPGTNRRKIEQVFKDVKQCLGVPMAADWMQPYYQFCNRIAALHTLDSCRVPSRLLFIYFIGDWIEKSSRKCPRTESDWRPAINRQAKHVMLPCKHALSSRIHKLFLDVRR